jgi:hypothetical protein
VTTVFINPAINGEVGKDSRVRLDGARYKLTAYWLAEAPRFDFQPAPPDLEAGEPGLWMLTIADDSGTVLAPGLALRNGVDVLAGLTVEGLPPGRLLAADTTRQGRDPGRGDLDPGSEVRLAYVLAS